MITKYIQAAMRKAHYEILIDDSSYFGQLPGCEGVYANAQTLEDCRDELEEVLEEWLLFRISQQLSVPQVDGLELKIKDVA